MVPLAIKLNNEGGNPTVITQSKCKILQIGASPEATGAGMCVCVHLCVCKCVSLSSRSLACLLGNDISNPQLQHEGTPALWQKVQ